MHQNQITQLLGREAADPVVDRMLDIYNISRRPEVELDEDAVDGQVVNQQDWLLNRHLGIEFGFEDKATFLAAHPDEIATGPMLLTQIYFYGSHDGVEPYRESLPFGLLLSDSRAVVRAKLSRWESTRRSFVRDTWEVPDWRLTVSYVNDGASIGFLVCTLRPPRLRADDDDLPLLPDTERVLGVLGKALNDPALRLVLAPLLRQQALVDRGDRWVADFRLRWGMELEFMFYRGSRDLALTSVTFFREHFMQAVGWPGLLPFRLSFDDSPGHMLRKIGRDPDLIANQTFAGDAVWNFETYTLRVKYSTMENFILRVQIVAPGAWDAV